MAKKLTAEGIRKRLSTHRVPGILFDESTFVSTATPARFIDPDFGEWWARPSHVLRGSGHPKRGGSAKLSIEEVKSRLSKWPFIRLVEDTYKSISIKAKFIDSVFGEWWAKPADVLLGHQHKERGRIKLRTPVSDIQEFLDREKPHLRLEQSTFVSVNKKALFIDTRFGEWWVLPKNVLRGCDHPRRAPNRKFTPEEIQEMLPKNVQLDASSYVDTHQVAVFVDSKYGEWKATPNNVIHKKSGHPNAAITSSLEEDFARELDIPRYNLVLPRLKELGYSYKPDFKISETVFLNLDGLYWHSELVISDKYHHFNMRKAYAEAGLRLIQIREDEWHNSKEIVKSQIAHHLGKSKVIPARKLEIRDGIPNDFFKTNHLMGNAFGAKCFGLYDGETCYAGISVQLRNEEMHIIRFCNKLDHSVVGGYSKLEKAAINKLNPKTVVSFVDLRYGNGSSLLNIGYQLIKTTLGWKWTNGKSTFNRLSCRATPELSQRENATRRKLYRIYDAGQAKFVKELP